MAIYIFLKSHYAIFIFSFKKMLKYYQLDSNFGSSDKIIDNFRLQHPFCQLFWNHALIIFNFIRRIIILIKFIYINIYIFIIGLYMGYDILFSV